MWIEYLGLIKQPTWRPLGSASDPCANPKCATIFTRMEEQRSPLIFAEWLKRRRKMLDLTQEELAQRAGCTVFALRKIESGERRPSKQLAGLLARALEIADEDQQTFIRVARGELITERLRLSSLESITSLSGLQPAPPSSRVPVQATPLIGRDAELAAMEKLFVDPQCRLLTLTGVGGIGKTRLAVEFAARQLSAFPGGVFYVPLAPVTSTEAIVPAIADVLGFGFSGPAGPKEQLISYAASFIKREALVVLDNLEHLLVQPTPGEDEPGVVELVSEMLRRLPHVRVLGTSRERLNLQGEWTYELHGLPVPPLEFAGKLEDYSAADLFIQSARRAKAGFEVTEDQRPHVAHICHLLEGTPLAIELAAAWAGMLSCQEIVQEIKSSTDFLATSMRDVPERHRSMRATFDHSWKLLAAEERRALCRLSVFHGGFDRNAADQIAGASLPLLASLNAKSLVRRTESGRYDLHEVIRQYASSHLADDSHGPETVERHCEYYLSFARGHEKSLKSASQQEAVRQLTDEIDNIRAAWTWAIRHEKYAELGQAARSLGWYFEVAGLYREGIEQLESLAHALRARSQDPRWRRLWGLTLIQQALLYFRKGEFDRAQAYYEDSIISLRPIGDPILLADALVFLGVMLHLSGDYERAKSLVEEGLIFARAGNEKWFEAFAIYNLGYLDSLMGRYAEGHEQMLAGLNMWRALGDPHSIALGLNYLVPTLSKLGRYEEAKTFMHESIALCAQAKNRWGLGTAYRFLGLATLAAGQFAEAQVHFRKSLEVFGEYFVGWDIARSLTYLGDATMLSGDLAGARRIYLDGLRLSMQEKAIPIALDALSGLSNLQAQAGRAEPALMLCHFILNHSSSDDETKTRAQQLRAELEAKLSPEQVASARAKAREKTFDVIAKDMI